MPDNELGEFQKEWRAIVLDKLTSVEKSQNEVRADIVDIKTTFVKQQSLEALRETNRADIKELKDKVEILEQFKFKLAGVVISINVLIALAEVASHFYIK